MLTTFFVLILMVQVSQLRADLWEYKKYPEPPQKQCMIEMKNSGIKIIIAQNPI